MNRLVAASGVWRHWQATDSERLANARPEQLRRLLEHADRRAIPEGSVWTFNVSPDSVYGVGNRYTFDTIGIWETANQFEDWRLRVVNVEVPLP